MNTLADHPRRDARTLPRRRVYLGEGLTFEIEGRDAWLRARRSTSPTRASEWRWSSRPT